MADDDFLSLPLSERIKSAKWNARSSAYAELTKLFTLAEDDSDPIFNQYGKFKHNF